MATASAQWTVKGSKIGADRRMEYTLVRDNGQEKKVSRRTLGAMTSKGLIREDAEA